MHHPREAHECGSKMREKEKGKDERTHPVEPSPQVDEGEESESSDLDLSEEDSDSGIDCEEVFGELEWGILSAPVHVDINKNTDIDELTLPDLRPPSLGTSPQVDSTPME